MLTCSYCSGDVTGLRLFFFSPLLPNRPHDEQRVRDEGESVLTWALLTHPNW
jgi:hypothetical protein